LKVFLGFGLGTKFGCLLDLLVKGLLSELLNDCGLGVFSCLRYLWGFWGWRVCSCVVGFLAVGLHVIREHQDALYDEEDAHDYADAGWENDAYDAEDYADRR